MDGNSLPVTSVEENEDGFWNVPYLTLQISFLLHLREHASFCLIFPSPRFAFSTCMLSAIQIQALFNYMNRLSKENLKVLIRLQYFH